MANKGTIQDLDEWLLKLDNLQRALKSCSSSQPRRLQSPLVLPREQSVDGMLFQPVRSDRPLPAIHYHQPQTPPTVSPQRRCPQPPVRKVFPSATDPPQRKFGPSVSPVHHYFPGEQFPMPNRHSNGNIDFEQNGNNTQLQQNQQNLQQQPKPKSVRWSSEPMLSPVDMPDIPPPPAFTNGCQESEPNDTILVQQEIPSPTMQHSPLPLCRNGSPATDRSSLQSQDTYNTLTRGRSPQPSYWVGNLHFWKSLQNREGVDSLNSRTQKDSEQDKKVVLRVHQPDRTTKAVYVQSQTDAGEVVLMLAAKNFLPLSTKMALVEKVPSMKLGKIQLLEALPSSFTSSPLNSCLN
ncbi:unnamed protein product [Rodentolepis nana]|uniref:Ras-associating domain-containing protein n=1 Tax=Rodentolepis nana TaxID=102285 RepID=A0A158QJJ1_RODNA|nr:unnamed protein product [Rodentolepis nana]